MIVRTTTTTIPSPRARLVARGAGVRGLLDRPGRERERRRADADLAAGGRAQGAAAGLADQAQAREVLRGEAGLRATGADVLDEHLTAGRRAQRGGDAHDLPAALEE